MRVRRAIYIILFSILIWSGQTAGQPPYDLRPIAEFEHQEGIIIGWYGPGMFGAAGDTMFARVVDEVQDVAVAYVALRQQSSVAPVSNFLTSLGIPLSNVEFMVTSSLFSVWVRDFGPEFVLRESGERLIVEGGHAPEFPAYLATEWSIGHYHVPLYMDGGNFMTDGAREVAVSGRYIYDPNGWQTTIRNYYDLPLHIVPPLLNEPCGHIDMYARFVAHDKVVISEYANPAYNENMDLAADQFLARGYEVFRVPTPAVTRAPIPKRALENPRLLHLPPGAPIPTGGNRSVYRTYTNGIQVNGKYLLPVYGHAFDSQAQAIYQSALPDHEIVPINCSCIIPYGGAMHCTSSDVQPAGPARPEIVTISPVAGHAVLTWSSVEGAVLYDVYRLESSCGFEIGLDDYVASIGDTTWMDPDGLSDSTIQAYHIACVNSEGSRSIFTPRWGYLQFVNERFRISHRGFP